MASAKLRPVGAPVKKTRKRVPTPVPTPAPRAIKPVGVAIGTIAESVQGVVVGPHVGQGHS